MLSTIENIIFLVLATPIIISGLISNPSIIAITLKNINTRTTLNLLTLPIYFVGFTSIAILIPLVILNVYINNDSSSTLCNIIIILHYMLCIIFFLSILVLLSLRLIYLIFPTFLNRFTIKQVLLTTFGLIFLVTLSFLINMLTKTNSVILIPICAQSPAEGSALRFSLYAGIGIFLTLFLIAVQMLVNEVTSRKQMNFSPTPSPSINLLTKKETEKVLVTTVFMFFMSHAAVEMSLFYHNTHISHWMFLIFIIIIGHGLSAAVLPSWILFKIR